VVHALTEEVLHYNVHTSIFDIVVSNKLPDEQSRLVMVVVKFTDGFGVSIHGAAVVLCSLVHQPLEYHSGMF
jgi:hypothetical protein